MPGDSRPSPAPPSCHTHSVTCSHCSHWLLWEHQHRHLHRRSGADSGPCQAAQEKLRDLLLYSDMNTEQRVYNVQWLYCTVHCYCTGQSEHHYGKSTVELPLDIKVINQCRNFLSINQSVTHLLFDLTEEVQMSLSIMKIRQDSEGTLNFTVDIHIFLKNIIQFFIPWRTKDMTNEVVQMCPSDAGSVQSSCQSSSLLSLLRHPAGNKAITSPTTTTVVKTTDLMFNEIYI